MQNDEGCFPLFRIMHIFQATLYESEKNKRLKDQARTILDLLIKSKYDFLHKSCTRMVEFHDVTTFEAMILSSLYPEFLKDISIYLRDSFPKEFYAYVDQIE